MTEDKDGTKFEDKLGYNAMVTAAMRLVVRSALAKVAREGLPGGHHFYITFDTQAPGVEIADWLRKKHPNDMTIVLQNRFWGLKCYERHFEVQLSFSQKLEKMHVPFSALLAFADPAAKFVLQFHRNEGGSGKSEEGAQAQKPKKKKPVMRLVKDGEVPSAPEQDDAEKPAAQEKGGVDDVLTAPGGELEIGTAPPEKKAEKAKAEKESAEKPSDAKGGEAGNVVSLDAFRKK